MKSSLEKDMDNLCDKVTASKPKFGTMKHYSKLRKQMTEEQKAKADALYKECMKEYEQFSHIISASFNPEDAKYCTKIEHGEEPK